MLHFLFHAGRSSFGFHTGFLIKFHRSGVDLRLTSPPPRRSRWVETSNGVPSITGTTKVPAWPLSTTRPVFSPAADRVITAVSWNVTWGTPKESKDLDVASRISPEVTGDFVRTTEVVVGSTPSTFSSTCRHMCTALYGPVQYPKLYGKERRRVSRRSRASCATKVWSPSTATTSLTTTEGSLSPKIGFKTWKTRTQCLLWLKSYPENSNFQAMFFRQKSVNVENRLRQTRITKLG